MLTRAPCERYYIRTCNDKVQRRMLKPDPPAPSTVDDLDTASLLDGCFEQLRVRPSETALLDQDGAWSYNEVFRAAASVAHALIALECPDAPTCLVVADRSRRSVAAAFGALMAGWSYCLVDRGYPSEKLQPVIGRLQPGAVVDCNSGAPAEGWPAATGLPTLHIDDLIGHREKLAAPVSDDEIESWSPRLGRGTDVAFYTFTSGTTGRPKVPVISHGSFLDITRRYVADYELSSDDRIAVQSGFMFDAMLDVFAATQCGAVAVIMPDLLFEDGRSWARFLRQHGATTLLTVPAALQYALESMPRGQPLPPFRQLILTGDRVSRHVLNLIERHVPRDVVLHNSYGVAEALYITTGIIDTDHPETASLFYLPDADRVDYRLVPVNDGKPDGHLLQVRGNGVFLGYAE
jgi:non-ribosomal peptide synthetase component F